MPFPSALGRRIGPATLASLLLAGLLLAGPVSPVLVSPALAQNAAPAASEAADFKTRLTQWQDTLNKAANRLAAGDLDNAEYEALRAQLLAVQQAAREAGGASVASRETAQRMLDALGPAPAQGAAPEAAPIAAERKRLSQTIAEVEGRGKQADLIVARADILLRTAADQRMTQLTEQIAKRGPVPLSPVSWAALPEQVAYVQERVGRAFAIVLAEGEWRDRLYGLGALAAFLVLVAWPVRRALLRRYGHRDGVERPSYRQRVAAMAVEALARCLMPVVPTVAITASLVGLLRDVPDAGPLTALLLGLSGGLSAFFLVTGVARAILSPDHPAWQLADLSPDSARRLVRRIAVASVGLAVAGTGIGLTEGMFMPPELRSVMGLGTMALLALSLLSLLPDRLWIAAPVVEEVDDCGCPEPVELTPAPAHAVWPRLRLAIGAIAVAALAAAAAGYLAGAVYAAKLMLTTIIVGGVLLVARGVLRELLCVLLERGSGQVAEVRDLVVATDKGRRMLGHAGRVTIDAALLAVASFFLMPLTGMTLSEMKGLADSFLSGVTVGGVRIAPGDILSALLVLASIVAVTRFVQRQLDERILGRVGIDEGVRNSIRTGVGYLGTTLAVLVSVGTLGLDLSSLAMIASALSVGIGFGLQNVVSNFISGLIMLVERPIKVGDWVVVNGMEGTVRRISVRATEIQTFQRASVIIPNSEFISKAVVNWTLKDKTTRIEIKLRVTYDSDVRLVHDLLLKIAYGHEQVLRIPEPVVMFREFGPSGLEFELRSFVANTDHILPVRNELRMRIIEEFRAQGIQMPFDQRVVHMPKVEELLEALAESRAVKAIPAAVPAREKEPSPVD
ncbi:DUF3772 domain-containing protein [Azospirillum soli]|uniref:DUF3772 domain-containing protein n=1 Tax=Azospirillum soli TaxID=1304799 RepID=UPI001AE447BA|nr:DUF3772 domain-containing protein [Azospirillum soli]MBP2312828.1 small-conductance mechanosensitive channel [Azospirillum soli]